MAGLDGDTPLVRSPAPITATVDDDLVMLDPKSGQYFGTNTIGERIWELLEQPRTLTELIDMLAGEYDVDRATCERDVTDFVAELLDAELVEHP